AKPVIHRSIWADRRAWSPRRDIAFSVPSGSSEAGLMNPPPSSEYSVSIRARTESICSSLPALTPTNDRGRFRTRVLMSAVLRPLPVPLIALRTIDSRSLVCFSHWRWSELGAKSSITHIIDFAIAFSIQARVSIAEPGRRSALHAPPREAQNDWIIEASRSEEH